MDGDRVGVVRIGGIAAKLELAARRGRLGLQGVGVVGAGSGHPDDPKAASLELRRVAGQVLTAVGIDRREAGEPDRVSLVGVPVALLEGDVDAFAQDPAD